MLLIPFPSALDGSERLSSLLQILSKRRISISCDSTQPTSRVIVCVNGSDYLIEEERTLLA
jgi:hypothetical protein